MAERKIESDSQGSKVEARKSSRVRLQRTPVGADASSSLCAHLRRFLDSRPHIQLVAGFQAMGQEPDLTPLHLDGRSWCFPRMRGDTFEFARPQAGCSPGPWGFAEPAPDDPIVPLDSLGLVLVPGVAFGWQGQRLGRGRGHYDRVLRDVSGVRVGVGWAAQVEASLPMDPWDIPMDAVVTEAGWVNGHGGFSETYVSLTGELRVKSFAAKGE